MQNQGMLWNPYFMRDATGLADFWQKRLVEKERDILYVMGRGFDRRMCVGVSRIMALGGDGKRDCLLIHYEEGDESPSNRHAETARANEAYLDQLYDSRGSISHKTVAMWKSDGQAKWRVGSRKASDAISRQDIECYSDVIVDVSSMPRSIYLSLIAKLLYLLGFGRSSEVSPLPCNLHIVVAENAELDSQTKEENPDEDANYLHGFGTIDTQAKTGSPLIWMPILGEKQKIQLERIYTKIRPSEICPVLPAVSKDPRRGDRLLIDEYHDILFERWRIEPDNIIYAAEQNPFEAYRQILQAALHYGKALDPIGGCRIVLSAVSSKLLSIGALLAAYELHAIHSATKNTGIVGVGIAHVEAQGYTTMDASNGNILNDNSELFGMWLAGDCYA